MKFSLRDPMAWAAAIQALLVLAFSFDLFGLTPEGISMWMAVVNGVVGVVTAILTKRAGFSLAIGLVQAVISLAAWYGFKLDEQQMVAVIGLASIVLGLFGWTQNSPADQPGLREE